MKTLYTTTVDVAGGRDGRAVSADGLLDLALAAPVSIGGSGQGTNPEQLFAAGYAACFNSSLRYAARTKGLDAGDVSVRGTVSLGVGDDGAFGVRAHLAVVIPGLAGAERDEVVAEARRICAYSNATRGQVDTVIEVV